MSFQIIEFPQFVILPYTSILEVLQISGWERKWLAASVVGGKLAGFLSALYGCGRGGD